MLEENKLVFEQYFVTNTAHIEYVHLAVKM